MLISAAACEADDLQVPFTDVTISKDLFGFLVVMMDLLVSFCIYCGSLVIDRRLRQYVSAFKQQIIEMDDFTLTVKNIPLYTQDENLLKADLWQHMVKMATMYEKHNVVK